MTSGSAQSAGHCLNATPHSRMHSVRRARLLQLGALLGVLVAVCVLLPPVGALLNGLMGGVGPSSAAIVIALVSLLLASVLMVLASLSLIERHAAAFNVSDEVARLLDAAGDEVYVFDLATLKYLAVNDAACRNLSMQREEFDQLGPLQVAPALGQLALEECCNAARDSGTVYRLERLRHRRRDGTGYPVEMVISHVPSAGRDVFMAVANDITVRRAAEQQLEFVAHHDPLTELPNRALFMDRMKQATLTADRSAGLFAVMFCDLDLFKRINDTFGHDVGDAVLKAVGTRLSENLRASDTVARLAGDEFTLLACGLPGREDAERLARKLLRAFEEPFKIGQHDIQIGLSIGVTLYPLDSCDPLALLQHADQAMYAVKRAGRGDYNVYEPELLEVTERRMRIEAALGHAIALDELDLCFTPVVDMRNQSIPVYRAEVHWEPSELGRIDPAEVISTAQQIGRLEDVELWMLRSACEALHLWQRTISKYASTVMLPRVIVSLSTWQLRKRDFSDNVDELVRRYKIPADHLVIGLEEGGLLDALEGVSAGFEALRRIGVRFNVDEFGSGYQRLGRMPRFPVQSFSLAKDVLSGLPGDDAMTAVRSLVAAASSLGAEVIAPNVESEGQSHALMSLGCALISGRVAGSSRSDKQVLAALKGADKGPVASLDAS